jgi:AraC family L-rhamnose operon transcriptional activator RhaR/AraC family L-rhamnose operon regulatory protein RhaS
VFTVPEKGRHGYRDADALELVNIMFDLEAFLRANPELKNLPGFYSLFYLEPRFRRDHRFQSRLTLGPEDLDFAASLARLLGEEFRGRSEGYRPAIRTYLHALLVFLSRRFCEPQNPSAQSMRMHRMAESLSYLERHYRQDLGVARLAELACLSPRQYDRVFKSLYNRSPKSYMISLRLGYARALLEKGTMDTGSIAMECGFSSPSHFSRQFKAHYGIIPKACRNAAGSSDTGEKQQR